jgi:hypothetical protein
MSTGRQVTHSAPGLNGSVELPAVPALDARQLLPLSLLPHNLLVLVPFTDTHIKATS